MKIQGSEAMLWSGGPNPTEGFYQKSIYKFLFLNKNKFKLTFNDKI